MIENKVLVTINVPYLEDRYDVYIPVNRKVYSVIRMLVKTLHTISHGSFDEKKQYVLYNEVNGDMYDMNTLIRDTDIRNGSTIILL